METGTDQHLGREDLERLNVREQLRKVDDLVEHAGRKRRLKSLGLFDDLIVGDGDLASESFEEDRVGTRVDFQDRHSAVRYLLGRGQPIESQAQADRKRSGLLVGNEVRLTHQISLVDPRVILALLLDGHFHRDVRVVGQQAEDDGAIRPGDERSS
jgi:hypothetical protein